MSAELSHVEAEGIGLLVKMLQFNPILRPTAAECIASPFFNDVRKYSKVRTAKKQVDLPIEYVDELSLQDLRSEYLTVINDF